jgi:hypothetical protein
MSNCLSGARAHPEPHRDLRVFTGRAALLLAYGVRMPWLGTECRLEQKAVFPKRATGQASLWAMAAPTCGVLVGSLGPQGSFARAETPSDDFPAKGTVSRPNSTSCFPPRIAS